MATTTGRKGGRLNVTAGGAMPARTWAARHGAPAARLPQHRGSVRVRATTPGARLPLLRAAPAAVIPYGSIHGAPRSRQARARVCGRPRRRRRTCNGHHRPAGRRIARTSCTSPTDASTPRAWRSATTSGGCAVRTDPPPQFVKSIGSVIVNSPRPGRTPARQGRERSDGCAPRTRRAPVRSAQTCAPGYRAGPTPDPSSY